MILISMLFFLAFRQGLILVQAFLELTMYSRLASNPWQSCLNLLIVGITGTSYHYRLFLLLKMIGKKKKTRFHIFMEAVPIFYFPVNGVV